MITQEELLYLFEHRNGSLYWKNKLPNSHVPVGAKAGGFTEKGYRKIRVLGKKYFEHRLVWMMFNGEWPKELDHINGIRDDNRLENLRLCSRSQNLMNAVGWNNSSGVKGVYFSNTHGRWIAQLTINGVRKNLGYFDTLTEATAVVTSARNKHHGDFANSGVRRSTVSNTLN